MKTLPIEPEEVSPRYSADDVVDESTGEVLLECNEEVTEEKVEELRKRGIKRVQGPLHRRPERAAVPARHADARTRSTRPRRRSWRSTGACARAIRRRRRRRPTLFNNLFFNPERYDLSKVGRLKLNYKFGLEEPLDNQVLTKRDILEVVRYLIDLKNGKGGTSTTSTTSATAACARWASCSRTSTASVWSAWSAPSRSA